VQCFHNERALREAQLWDEVKDRMGSPASSLSGGQQQRLCLARTLALEPEILLLDEPTASVDHASARRIEELLLQLKVRYTLVVVSHGLGQARRLADRVILFREGSVVETMEREECCEPGRLEELIGE
jgi:phosphate transport system ATP-binding protein